MGSNLGASCLNFKADYRSLFNLEPSILRVPRSDIFPGEERLEVGLCMQGTICRL